MRGYFHLVKHFSSSYFLQRFRQFLTPLTIKAQKQVYNFIIDEIVIKKKKIVLFYLAQHSF